jgi:phosphoglycolate phosphatase
VSPLRPIPRPPAAIIFDLDGTLVDSAPDLAAALDATLVRFGRPTLGLTAARAMIGDGVRVLVERGFAATGGASAALDDAVDVFRSIYLANIAVATRPYPRVLPTLEHFAARAIPMAVCTNKPREATDRLLAALDLARFFAAVVGGDEGPRKPDAWPVREAIRRLGCVGAAVMVGDSHHDATAARAAGLAIIGVRYGYGAPAAAAPGDTVINEFAELPRVLDLT